MPQPNYLISLSPWGFECAPYARGEMQAYPVFAQPQALLQFDAEHVLPAFADFLDFCGISGAHATLILPVMAISTRELEFEFYDLKKIQQILPFELENELLEDLNEYCFDRYTEKNGEAGGRAIVYLMRRDLMRGLAGACESRGIHIEKMIPGATEMIVNGNREGHLVYLGAGESYIAELNPEGPPRRLVSLPGQPQAYIGPWLGETGPPAAPAPVGGGAESGSTSGGWEASRQDAPEPTAGPVAEGPAAPVADTDWSMGMREELEQTRQEINRYFRVHPPLEEHPPQLRGIFAHLFRWDAGRGTIEFLGEELPRPMRSGLRGLLGDISPDALKTRRSNGLSFYKSVASWKAAVDGVKWPLIAAGGLLLVLLTQFAVGYVVRTSAEKAELERVNAEISALLKLPGTTPPSRLKAELDKMERELMEQKGAQAMANILENYNYDALNLVREVSMVYKGMPQVTLTTFNFNRERLSLGGTTPSYNESETLKTAIGKLEMFKGETAKVAHSRSGDTIQYRLTVER